MKRLIAFCLCATLVLGCSACGTTNPKKPEYTKYSAYAFDYFDTATVITGYAESQEAFDSIANEALALLGEYHQLYNIYLRYDGVTNLCSVNELKDGKHNTVTVDQKIIDMLLFAREMYDKTGGMTNVAMGSVLKLWHDYRTLGMDDPSDASLPPMDKLTEASQHVDITNMVIDEANNTVTLTDPKMRLDVGAVAKGYATEQVARWLEAQGVSGWLLNVGGNVRAVGKKPDGSLWMAGLENPDEDAKDYLAYLQLESEALVTSGSYQRYYIVDGKSYHHIIHPDTLMPSEGYLSVSVICPDSGMGDALSTALFCMPLEDGKALVESMEGVEALWLTTDGVQTTTSGWHKYVKK
jgi:thiamine biosynthesis lipoprotein